MRVTTPRTPKNSKLPSSLVRMESDNGCLGLACLGLTWPALPFALSSRILYLGTSSSRIALASFLVTCIIDLSRWSPCSRHCQLAGPPFVPLALLGLENNLTSRQVRGSTVKSDHLAIMDNTMLPWAFPTQNSFYGRIASNVRSVCTLSSTIELER